MTTGPASHCASAIPLGNVWLMVRSARPKRSPAGGVPVPMYVAVPANIGLFCSQIVVQVRHEHAAARVGVVGDVVDADACGFMSTNSLVLPSHDSSVTS